MKIGRNAPWRVDLQSLPIAFEKTPDSRPCAVLIESDGLVVGTELVDRPSAEVDGVAEVLATSVSKAVQSVGEAPEILEVRDAAVAEALATALEQEPWTPTVRTADLAEMDEPWRALKLEMTGRSEVVSHTMPQTWAGWGRSPDWVAELFASSARFVRAAPWRFFDDAPPLLMTLPASASSGTGSPETASSKTASPVIAGPGEDTWAVSVLGSGGFERGVVIYSDLADLEALLSSPEGVMPDTRGRHLALTFSQGHQVPVPMRREVSRAHWEVAAADAYPILITHGTLGGGVSQSDGEALRAALEGLASWAEAFDAEEAGVTLEDRLDPVSGARFIGPEEETPRTQPLPFGGLEPGDAVGDGARPEAALERLDQEDEGTPVVGGLEAELTAWLDRFEEALQRQGLGEATCARHLEGAEAFLAFLLGSARTPVEGVHSFDLMVFLYSFFPHHIPVPRSRANQLHPALKRFFGFLEKDADIVCPWATEILADKQRFLATWEALSPQGSGTPSEDVVDLNFELYRRGLLPPREISPTLAWDPEGGDAEARLYEEVRLRWLLWRDAAVRAGEGHRDALLRHLEGRLDGWMEQAHPKFGGRTPLAVIEAERAGRPADAPV